MGSPSRSLRHCCRQGIEMDIWLRPRRTTLALGTRHKSCGREYFLRWDGGGSSRRAISIMGSILVGQAGVAILCFAVTDSTEFRKIDSTSFGRHAVTQVIKPKPILGARSAQEISGMRRTKSSTSHLPEIQTHGGTPCFGDCSRRR